MHRGAVTDALARGAGSLIQRFWRHIPESARSLTFPAAHHYDFSTPEYAHFDEIVAKKWESTRGVGHSFGANRNERPEDIVTATELVRSFCDIVSKNGNLLIGIGPDEHGVVPAEQLAPLEGLGAWLRTNGEAIYGTRPWSAAEGTTSEHTQLRFTQRDGDLYAILLELPATRAFSFPGLAAGGVESVRLLGVDTPIDWVVRDGRLTVTLPEQVPTSGAHVLALRRGALPA